MKPTLNYGLSDSLIDAVRKAVEEALVGGQKKLDVDKDGKLEKTDFASLRAKKNTIDTKPKLKEDHPDEKEDKVLIKKLIKKADVSDDEEDKALIKKTMKKEESEQIDELSVNKMLKYTDAANKNREVLNKKWDTGTATEREKNKVLGHEAGVDRAAARVKAKTGKNPNEIGKLSRMKYAVTKEESEQMDETEEQIDELSRGTLKSYVKKANKSAQHYSFEPTVRDPESGNQYRPTYTKRSKGIDLAKDKIKREEVEQMDETVKNFDVHPKHARKIAQHLNNVGIRTKTSANDDRGLANDDPGSVNITATHKDPAHLAIHISRAVDAHARDHALSARMRGQLRASGVEPKPKREEYEQMDEAPMKSGAQSRREVDSVMDKYGFGSKQKEAPKSNTRAVVGKSYGADYKDPEGEDETAADMKKPEPKRKSGPQGTMARRFNTKSYDKIKGKLKAQY